MDPRTSANYSTAQAKGAAPRADTISNAIEDFDAVISRLERYGSRLFDIADRLGGPRPTAVSEKADNPTPSVHILHSVHQRRDRLVEAADIVERELNRIESAL